MLDGWGMGFHDDRAFAVSGEISPRDGTPSPAPAFEPIELLSIGPRAEIWRAIDRTDNAAVVVKILAPGREVDDSALDLADLGHPAFVRVVRRGHLATGRAYVVLELVEGLRLRRVLGGGRLEPELALPILEQIASALVVAHRCGNAHGALTPEHVMLVEDADKWCRVRLLGLGASTGALDPGYAAPEQLAGAAPDVRADVFAFGALAVEILGGIAPFGATSLCSDDTLAQRRAGARPRIALPAGLDQHADVLARALAADPADRWPSVEALAEALLGRPLACDWLARGTQPVIPYTEV